MTSDELIRELRDIHPPDAALHQVGVGFSWLPIAALVICLLALLWVRYKRSRIWLQQAREQLKVIGTEIDGAERCKDDCRDRCKDRCQHSGKPGSHRRSFEYQHSLLLDLAGQIAPYRIVTPLPAAVYLPPEQHDTKSLKQIYEHLRRVVE